MFDSITNKGSNTTYPRLMEYDKYLEDMTRKHVNTMLVLLPEHLFEMPHYLEANNRLLEAYREARDKLHEAFPNLKKHKKPTRLH